MFAATAARGDDLDDQLAEMLGLAAEYVGATLGATYLLDADHDELELAVTYGIEDAVPDEANAVTRAASACAERRAVHDDISAERRRLPHRGSRRVSGDSLSRRGSPPGRTPASRSRSARSVPRAARTPRGGRRPRRG